MKEKTYTFKVITNEDGSTKLTRTNEGFNLLELMGIVTLIKNELFLFFDKETAPHIDIIERNVVKPSPL